MNACNHSHDIWSEALPPRRKFREWRFGMKDVVILIGMGLAISGLTGLGALMVVELIDSFLK